jgi:RNA polymerase sigma-70 factor, ECF subfamily
MEAVRVASHSLRCSGALENPMDELVVRAREGDRDAFRPIYDRFARPLLQFIFDMTGQRDHAEDLLQETFIRAFRHLGDLREPARFSTWLFGIARNVCLESWRSRERDRRKVDLDEEEALELPDAAPLPEGTLLNRELNSIIRQSMNALEVDKRQVFLLKVFYGHSYEEIMEITGFSLPKVKTDLHRARAEMRTRLRPYLEVSHEL